MTLSRIGLGEGSGRVAAEISCASERLGGGFATFVRSTYHLPAIEAMVGVVVRPRARRRAFSWYGVPPHPTENS